MNLRADPKNEGDLRDYLPGYTVPHGARKRLQAIQVDFRNGRRSKRKAENLVVGVSPQLLFAVVHVPPNVSGVVTFQLIEPTNHPGIATNLVEPGQDNPGYVPRPDFTLFDPVSGMHTTGPVTVPVDPEQHRARVRLFCWDFGGNVEVFANARLFDRPNDEPMTMNVPDFDPGSRFPHALPKAWIREVGAEPFLEDNDGSTRGIPGEKRGDGFRNHEEYRGFFMLARHWRLNEKETDGPGGDFGQKGGPFVKDLFLVDLSGLYQFNERGGHDADVPGLRLRDNRFLLAHGLVIHLIHPWEMASRGVEVLPDIPGLWPSGGPVNFNGANDQCAVVLVNQKLLDSPDEKTTGLTPGPLVVNLVRTSASGGTEVFSRPIAVDVKKRRDTANADGRMEQLHELLHRTVAHELGHRIFLSHSSLILDLEADNKPVPAPAGGPRIAEFWVDSEDTGAPILRWWGPVQFLSIRGATLAHPLEGLGGPDPRAKRMTLLFLDGRTTMIVREGIKDQASLYSYRLARPAGQARHPVFLNAHLHYLMDQTPEYENMQDELSPEDRTSLDLKRRMRVR